MLEAEKKKKKLTVQHQKESLACLKYPLKILKLFSRKKK